VKRSGSPPNVLIPPAVFLAAFGYLYVFHRLGWFVEDEGVLYYQYLRVFHGEVPYRDFFTGYPPMVYYLHAWVFSLFGVSIHVIRVLMAVVNALTAAGLYVVGRRLAPRGFALIPPVLFLVMQPSDTAVMVFLNSPYPSWYATTFAVWGTWAMLRALEATGTRRRVAWLVTAGVFGGLTLLSKQTAGVFFLWGVSGAFASYPVPKPSPWEAEAPLARALRVGYLALLPLAALLLVKEFLGAATLALFVVPLAVLAVIGARQRFGPAAWRTLVVGFVCVALGVALTITPWLVYFAMQMGFVPFLSALLFLGSDVERNLYIPFPPALATTVLLLAPLAVWGLLVGASGSAAKTRAPAPAARLRALAVLTVVALAVALALQAAAIGRVLRLDYNLWQIYSFTSEALDNLAAYLCVLVLAAALIVAWRQAQGAVLEEDPEPAAFACVLWLAVCTFLAYYPRMDYAHLFGALPLLYTVGVGLIARLRRSLIVACGGARYATLGFNLSCCALIGFIAATKSAPKVYSRVMVARTAQGIRLVPTPAEWVDFGRAGLYVPIYLERQRLHVAAIRDLIRYIQDTTPEGEPVFAFPALPMVYFLSGHDNPTRHDYFLGDNVSFREQLEVIRTLERQRVPTVVLDNDPANYFVAKSRAFTRVMSAYLRQRYYLERRIGSYDVMRRYGSPPRGGDRFDDR